MRFLIWYFIVQAIVFFVSKNLSVLGISSTALAILGVFFALDENIGLENMIKGMSKRSWDKSLGFFRIRISFSEDDYNNITARVSFSGSITAQSFIMLLFGIIFQILGQFI